MAQNRILIFEYVSGGGFNNLEIPLSLFSEGFGMLKVIIQDFKALNFQIKTMLDYRIINLANQLHFDFIKEITKGMDVMREFKLIIRDCDYVFIIAPEFSNILYDFTNIATKMKKIILSMSLRPIRIGSSKYKTCSYFRNLTIPTPNTIKLKKRDGHIDLSDTLNSIKSFQPPFILKPDDGVGAESIYYFTELKKFKAHIDKDPSIIDPSKEYLIQEYISGKDLSVSIIKRENFDDPLILFINSQKIIIKNNQIQYLGGTTPFKGSALIKEKLNEYINKLDLKEFFGYFGIDFILKLDGEISFIEINPRLTTSYVGIRELAKKPPLKLLVHPETKINDVMDPKDKHFSKYFHLRLKLIDPEYNNDILNKLCLNIPQIITPPLPISSDGTGDTDFSCFVVIKGKSEQTLQKQISKILRKLKKFGFHPSNGDYQDY